MTSNPADNCLLEDQNSLIYRSPLFATKHFRTWKLWHSQDSSLPNVITFLRDCYYMAQLTPTFSSPQFGQAICIPHRNLESSFVPWDNSKPSEHSVRLHLILIQQHATSNNPLEHPEIDPHYLESSFGAWYISVEKFILNQLFCYLRHGDSGPAHQIYQSIG
jgi:hypothetical protein